MDFAIMKIHCSTNDQNTMRPTIRKRIRNKAQSAKESEIWSHGTGGAIKDFLEIRRLENIPQEVEENNADVFYGCCGSLFLITSS